MSFERKHSLRGRGLILFERAEDAMRGERALRRSGYACRLVAPPPALRRGCDLALEVNLVEQMGIERVLKSEEVDFVEIVPMGEEPAELLEIVKVIDLGEAMMVKAGNMKLTFDKQTGIILNTSGGGCPDIPYLHAKLVGEKLSEAPRPRDIGFTLCGLMLDRAFEEARRIWEEGNEPR